MDELPDNYYAAGLQLLDAGDFAGAITLFDRAIKLGLGNLAEIYVCRAEAQSRLGQWAAAEQSIQAALEIKPYMAPAYKERGNIRLAQRAYDQAIKEYTLALHIEPNYDEAHFQRGLVYEAKRRYTEAEADLTRALRLNPQLLEAYEARGRVRAAQFKFDAAIADLSMYLRSGGGRQFDNHSETQGYLLLLRLQRLVWRLLPPWRR